MPKVQFSNESCKGTIYRHHTNTFPVIIISVHYQPLSPLLGIFIIELETVAQESYLAGKRRLAALQKIGEVPKER